MALVLKNNAVSRLASSLAAGDTIVVVSDGTGAKFPAIVAGEWFPITVIRESGALEIMRCTARTLDTMTVVRAQENTAELTFNAGDRVELRMTAGAFDTLSAELKQQLADAVASAEQQVSAAVTSAEQQVAAFIPPYDGAGKALFTNALNNAAEWGSVVTPSGAQTLTNKTISDGTHAGNIDCQGSVRSSIIAMTGNIINCALGNYFTRSISADAAFSFSNVPSGRAYICTLELTHTSGTVTWPASVKWPGDFAPPLNIGKTHIFTFITDDGGARWRGAVLADYSN